MATISIKLAAGLALLSVIITGVVVNQLHSARYSFIAIDRIGCVARLDSHSGEVVIIGPAGNEVARYPNTKTDFDPFKEGKADLVQKP
jgi:hypothetical protein